MARVLAGRGTHVVIAARNLTAAETMCQAATSQPTSLRGAYRSTSSFRELNGARLEASVRAYGGAGQRKVSNKWLGCYLRPRVCDSPRLFLQRTIAFSSQLKQQFMWLAQSVRELNGARLEASVRAYGGAGQRKVSNKCQRAERGEAGGVSEGVRRRRPEEGVQQMVRMLPPPAGECPIWGSKAAACCSFGRSAPGPFVLCLIPSLCIVAALMLRWTHFSWNLVVTGKTYCM
ncbi:uncharacterized protein [Triticum aestivum]|uniref:uncharacterized protein isoform X2 n=1 Tax=Triticum aestivum TaxID=4565 RepID=UPI001D02035C|nr:uncharacterized protein LOC123190084 isoform X2 [Triticum aestivum]